MGKKIKINESTLSRIIERMVNEQQRSTVTDQPTTINAGVETNIVIALIDTLKMWETKEYKSDKSRWKEYYKVIENILTKHT